MYIESGKGGFTALETPADPDAWRVPAARRRVLAALRARFKAWRLRRQTERAISHLDPRLRADIGAPPKPDPLKHSGLWQ